MKKNVFSRTIAVLASMTVLGAASMISASAKGATVETVTVEPGTTTIAVKVTADEISCQGGKITYTAEAPITGVKFTPSALAKEGDLATGITAVYAGGEPFEDGIIDTLTFTLAEDAEPGTYPIKINIIEIDDNGDYVPEDEIVGVDGAIIVAAPETQPATTEAPTTTAAPTTEAPKKASPKTGSAGVAVAVAGLVTAGATAVVLKKKH